MVQEAVEDRGCQGAVAVEDGGPFLVGFIGGDEQGSFFVACADDLEQQVGTCFVDGQVADLVEHEKMGPGVFAQGELELPLFLSGDQVVDGFDGSGVEDLVASLAGLQGDGGGEVCFADTDGAEQDAVVLVLDKAQAGEMLDLGAVDTFGPLPVEGVEGFGRGQAGGFDAPLGTSFLSGEGFAMEEFVEVFQCAGLLLQCLGVEAFVVLTHPGELESLQGALDFLVLAIGRGLHGGCCLVAAVFVRDRRKH